MTSENTTQTAATHLYRAVINCSHEIERDSVVLHFDPKQPGHNALNQLNRRLAAAHQELAAMPMECGLSPRELLGLIEDAISLQKSNAGDGIDTHIALSDWAKKARAALAKHKEV